MDGDIYPNQFPPPASTQRVAEDPLHPPPFLSIYPPPESLLTPYPALLLRSTKDDLVGLTELGFVHSTHLIPACFLRSTPPHTIPDPPPKHLSKGARDLYNRNVVNQVWSMRDQYTNHLGRSSQNTGKGYERILWNSLNRFVNTRGNGDGLTLMFFHANGFSKEIWEPTIAHMISSSSLRDTVREIWCFEAIQHGDSAVLNAKSLMTAGIYDWIDHSRDIMNFLIHFLPLGEERNSPLPIHIPRVSISQSQQRLADGLPPNQRVVAIGHSFGGCTSALAAIHYPKLFSSMILIDPVVHPLRYSPEIEKQLVGDLARGAVVRRSTWATRGEAFELFSKSAFGSWNPDVLRSYVNHALFTLDGEVALKMPPIQEAISFSEMEVPYTTWHLLPLLDPKIPLFFIMPGMGQKGLGPSIERVRSLVWIRPENSSHTRITGAGHLIPQEKPQELAEVLTTFLIGKYTQYRALL